MKIKILKTALICTLLLNTSCGSLNSILYNTYRPTMHYLGNTGTPKEKIEVFFDVNDVSKPYKIMGILKGETNFYLTENVLKETKKQMIEKAKTLGANAIVFLQFHKETREYEKSNPSEGESKIGISTYTIFEAKLLNYKEL